MSKCSKIYGNLQQKPIELHRDSIHGILKTCLWDFPRFKAIYVWPASKKEIAICLCKFYVHRRRAVDILVKQCDKQKVDFDDYQSFIYHQDNCPKAIQGTYLDFSCTPDQRTLCDH